MIYKEKNNQIRETIKGLLNGSIIAGEFIRKQIKFIILLFLLGLFYISNRYHAESVFIDTENTKKEIEDLRAEKVELQTKLMHSSRFENVLNKLKEQDSKLTEPKSPHLKIQYHIEK